MLFIAARLNPGTTLVMGVQCCVTVHKCCHFLNHTESRREQIIKAVFSPFQMWAHRVFGCYWIVVIFTTAVHIHISIMAIIVWTHMQKKKKTGYDMVIIDWPFVVGIVSLGSLNGVAYFEYFLECWSCNNGSYAKTVCVLLCSWLFAVKWLKFGIKCVRALHFLLLVSLSLSLSVSL